MAQVILEIRGLVYWIGGPADDPGCFHPFAPVLPFLAILGSLIMRYYAKRHSSYFRDWMHTEYL